MYDFCPQGRKKVAVSKGSIVHPINFGSKKIVRTYVRRDEILHFKHNLRVWAVNRMATRTFRGNN